MRMSIIHNTKHHSNFPKFMVVEVDGTVRPARATVLRCHENKEAANESWRASAVDKIDL